MKNADTSRQDEFNLSEHKVALCKKKRYQNCTHPAYETYKDLTCFDIHHNVHQYPPCICSSTQEESQARIATSVRSSKRKNSNIHCAGKSQKTRNSNTPL